MLLYSNYKFINYKHDSIHIHNSPNIIKLNQKLSHRVFLNSPNSLLLSINYIFSPIVPYILSSLFCNNSCKIITYKNVLGLVF